MELTVRSVGSVTCVTLSGTGDDTVLVPLADRLVAAGPLPLVVDVSDLFLLDVNALRGFLAHLLDGDDGGRVTLVCRRRSGRRLLRHWAGNATRIVADVTDALAPARSSALPAAAISGRNR